MKYKAYNARKTLNSPHYIILQNFRDVFIFLSWLQKISIYFQFSDINVTYNFKYWLFLVNTMYNLSLINSLMIWCDYNFYMFSCLISLATLYYFCCHDYNTWKCDKKGNNCFKWLHTCLIIFELFLFLRHVHFSTKHL